MATNPMQRKSRISFLLGMLLMLVIAAVIVFLLQNKIKEQDKTINELKSSVTKVYVLASNVKSGQALTGDMFVQKDIPIDAIPSGATTDIYTTLQSYSLFDTNGNAIYYKNATSNTTSNGATGNTTSTQGQYYLLKTDREGKQVEKTIYVNTNQGEVTPATFLSAGQRAFYFAGDNNTQPEYITIAENAVIAKIDLNQNTVITTNMITRADEIISDDVRKAEYNVIALPVDLQPEEYVDIRFMLPNGQDFIVLSKKKVTIPQISGMYLADTIQMNLSEQDILMLSSAIVESFQLSGSKLYAERYVEAGLQKKASETYKPSPYVQTLINNDSNIVDNAIKGLQQRNDDIDKLLQENGMPENIETKIQESSGATLEERRNYLQTLTATPVS